MCHPRPDTEYMLDGFSGAIEVSGPTPVPFLADASTFAFAQKLKEANWAQSPRVPVAELERAEAAAVAAVAAIEEQRRGRQERYESANELAADEQRNRYVVPLDRLIDETQRFMPAQAPDAAVEQGGGQPPRPDSDQALDCHEAFEDLVEDTNGTPASREVFTAEDEQRVGDFLATNGFQSVTSKRRRWWEVSYPLHAAVKHNDADMVRLLLQKAADPSQKDSPAGLTPLKLAKRRNRGGSHDEVLSQLLTTT